ncbi:MAG: carbamoyltransferase C-terminal domain-containing protein, partial [Alphaproteobacteria bacterium]|nr:carbamoyltransferase C-terminal domain-containing protein [Alphaproteobacteria bacterium]
ARVQTVTDDAGHFYQLLKAFEALTGVPVLLNTSFNGPHEPIVDGPEEVVRSPVSNNLHALFMGGNLYIRGA